jgi:hypothetical protein
LLLRGSAATHFAQARKELRREQEPLPGDCEVEGVTVLAGIVAGAGLVGVLSMPLETAVIW